MQLYDLSLVIHPRISEVELPGTVETIRKEIQSSGARELQETHVGKQKLAYPVKGNHFGHILYFRFESDTNTINPLKQKLNLQPEIIRSMVSVVRHNMPFSLERKPMRGALRGARAETPASVPSAHTASASAPETAATPFVATEAPSTHTVAAQKVDLADLDKRIDDLLNKETF